MLFPFCMFFCDLENRDVTYNMHACMYVCDISNCYQIIKRLSEKIVVTDGTRHISNGMCDMCQGRSQKTILKWRREWEMENKTRTREKENDDDNVLVMRNGLQEYVEDLRWTGMVHQYVATCLYSMFWIQPCSPPHRHAWSPLGIHASMTLGNHV